MTFLLDFASLLESMIQRGLNGNFECTSCGKTSGDKKSMRRHVETHMELRHSCKFCDKVSKTRVGLAQHYSKYHGSEVVSPWAMSWMTWSYCPPRIHMFKKTVYIIGLKWISLKCQTLWWKQSNNWFILDFNNLLESMIERVNEEEVGMRFKCKSCEKRTANKQAIMRHAETHLDMVHSCNLCGRQSKTRVGLAQHYARFHGDLVQSPWTMNRS